MSCSQEESLSGQQAGMLRFTRGASARYPGYAQSPSPVSATGSRFRESGRGGPGNPQALPDYPLAQPAVPLRRPCLSCLSKTPAQGPRSIVAGISIVPEQFRVAVICDCVLHHTYYSYQGGLGSVGGVGRRTWPQLHCFHLCGYNSSIPLLCVLFPFCSLC